MVRLALAVLLLPWVAGAALAGDEASAADAVLAAHAAADRARLVELARGNDPDPWLVADALLARSEPAAALAFAQAALRPDTARLPAYVERRTSAPTPEAGRARLRRARAALRAGAWSDVVEQHAAVASHADHVATLRLRRCTGVALGALRRETEAALLLEGLATDAHALGWLSMAARALSRAGLNHVQSRRWSNAVAVLDRLIVLERERANRAGVVEAYLRLGFAHEGRGDTVQALESVQRSLEAARRAGDRKAQARSLSSLGRLHHLAGDLTRAIVTLEDAAQRLEATHDRARLAHTLIELGLVRKRAGDVEGAARAHERAYGLLRRLRDKPGMAVALSGLGGLCIRRGEYTRALACLEEARTLMEALGNRRGEAAVLAQLGELFTVLRDAERAEDCFAASFSIAEEIGDAEALERSTRRAAQAAPTDASQEQAIALLERALGCIPDGCDQEACSSILRRLGSLHLVQGEVGHALGRHEQALTAAEASGDPLQVTASLVELAALHRAMGTLDGALELDRRAVEIAGRAGSYEALARALWSRAETRLRRGDAARAVQDARRAAREASFVYTRLSEFEGSRAGELWRGLFDVGIEAAVGADSVHDAAWFLEAGRAGMLLSSLGGRDVLWAHVVPEALRREEARVRAAETTALAGYRRAYAKRRLQGIRRRQEELREVRMELARVIGRIRSEAREAANLVCPQPDALEVLQARLRPEEALVLFALLPRRALALVATPTEARLVELGFRVHVERALERLRFDSPDCATETAVAELRARLVTPLRLPARVRRVLVSPMGSLGLVPFALLLPGHEIAYVPSGTTYGILQQERHRRGHGVLALGDPDYRARGSRRRLYGAAPRSLVPLPGTRLEVEAVGSVRLLGAEATEQGFVKALAGRGRWRAVHFACHGLLRKDTPMASALALTAAQDSDGLLSALEILRLRVAADLVVLSACDSARGQVYDTEGVLGLTRAFMFAGAPRVLSSLWKVDDEATRALMVKFYALWNPPAPSEGPARALSAAAALRAAQAHVRAQPKWKHPHYWAAWVLWGLPD